jgi:hypothetical protein
MQIYAFNKCEDSFKFAINQREETDTIVSANQKAPSHRITLNKNRNKSMASDVQNEETEYGMSSCLNHYSSTQKGIDDK